MKRTLFFLIIVFFTTMLMAEKSQVISKQSGQEDRDFRIPLIGEKAPSFTAETTNGKLKFPEDYGHNWKILFSHPQDFTPVCSSEILELGNLQSEFDKIGVKIAVVSADPLEMHKRWVEALEGLSYKDRAPVKIRFPIIDDENLSVSKLYGMIHPATNSTQAVRGVFIISPDNIVDAIYFYPLNVGRSTDELLRMVAALQAVSSASQKEMTPANWKAGNDLLIAVPPKLDNSGAPPAGFYNLAWFMWYKKSN